jgi:hypothetical protein
VEFRAFCCFQPTEKSVCVNVRLSRDAGPALGDIRALGPGDAVWLSAGVQQRPDWGRYLDALSGAITRGAEVRWL